MNAPTVAAFVTLAVAALLGALQAFTGNMQTATMWAGRAIAPADFGPTPSNGVQDAITPPWQTKLQFVWMVGLVIVLIVGTLQLWFLGVGALLVAWCTSIATRFELPRRAADKRQRDHRRRGAGALRRSAAPSLAGPRTGVTPSAAEPRLIASLRASVWAACLRDETLMTSARPGVILNLGP